LRTLRPDEGLRCRLATLAAQLRKARATRLPNAMILLPRPVGDSSSMTTHDRPPMTDDGSERSIDRRADIPEDVAQLGGLRPVDVDALPTLDEIDDLGAITDTRTHMGELEARSADSDQPDETNWQNAESIVATETRAGETDDPAEAAEEGLAWIPPTDPPVTGDGLGGPDIAAGFGMTATDEPFDADHHASGLVPDDERTSRVMDALRSDAATAGIVDRLRIRTDGGSVEITGTVDDVSDEDAVLTVADLASGVATIVNRIHVAGLEGSPDKRLESDGGSR
jgi:hypothetical protein